MSDLKAQIHMYMDAIPCVELSVAQELIHERNKLREALQSVMDWNPKPEYWERPEAVARFEADMAKARKKVDSLCADAAAKKARR